MKKIWLILLTLAVISGVALLFRGDLAQIYSRVFSGLFEVEKNISAGIEEFKKEISTPPPLRRDNNDYGGILSKNGVIISTNAQRIKNGVLPLKENAQLSASAEIKAKDMLKNQYFAHESLIGEGVDDLAVQAGYSFIAIGENLALGNFENDDDLVQAWMDSPGHRANILSSKYQEIGVSVIQGVFEGNTVWIAVQHFGLPTSLCPEVNQSLKLRIDANQDKIDLLKMSLDNLKKRIDNNEFESKKDYDQAVSEYNNLVSQYNSLVSQTKGLIDEYNYQVKIFNNCINSI